MTSVVDAGARRTTDGRRDGGSQLATRDGKRASRVKGSRPTQVAALAGLGLVEVLVALAVAAVTVAALARSAAATLRARVDSGRGHAMAAIAERRLEELVALAPDRLAPLESAEEVRHETGTFVLVGRVGPGPCGDLWRLEAVVAPAAGGAPLRLWTLARGPWRASR